MCGVVGYSGRQRPEDRNRFISLCREACIRGVHAFGIAYIDDNGKLNVVKSQSFEKVMWAIPTPIPRKIIFHNRYSTSGDASVMSNNQPIYVDGDALVFNGTVDMGTKEEMEQRHDVELQTENDGELVLKNFQIGEPLKLISSNKVSFAGIFLTEQGGMYAIRNEMRPLWQFEVEGGKFIASTRDIASRSLISTKNGKEIEPLSIVEL